MPRTTGRAVEAARPDRHEHRPVGGGLVALDDGAEAVRSVGGSTPTSDSALVKKRAYSRCRIACSARANRAACGL
ncbi:hypothetical protein K2224_29065 (plasmid) [Streptomyces sp. BHT-5-2]|uniref:hypothetical protein n=1 Tax=Streptomyces sp. BHT-5-2 TaxID=2866715 RepID=UPI001C8DE08D|nr:hypothetical protein [Streptomyces sp. BHT-5-2]QZL07323.1 hypothetical protein K2224_29065 [Streptomyces sp. BHT-5-2]